MKYKFLLALCCIVSLAALSFLPVDTYTVSGTVTDKNKKPLPEVLVAEVGANNQTKTDATGTYTITVRKGATVRFINIGYDMQELKVTGNLTHDVMLLETATKLEDVVIVGYGKAMKHTLFGARSGTYAAPPSYQYDNRASGVIVEQKEVAPELDREGYDGIVENRFKKVTDNALSTFSIDVDGASYANVRRIIQSGNLPPAGAVRIEEMINYFHYDYPQPTGDAPFSINTELAVCPWNTDHQLALIGLQGKTIPTDDLPPSNLVFLIDVSGSMEAPNKLPLVKASMKMLAGQLRSNDRVAIVVYAGNAGLVLPPVSGDETDMINEAIDKLNAGGSTAGGAGIKLAYKTAKEYFNAEGNNRVIICTDGDFNVGASSDDELERMIEKERESGIYLSVLGFGMGNYQDAKMQKLADKGNGNHSYIDDMNEAKKVLVTEFGGTLFTIAKDVKLQVEFNPNTVQAYRLIGYENRVLNKEDFNNDKKDAGEMGSGHTVTALYEIIPVGVKDAMIEDVDDLKYQQPAKTMAGNTELMTIKFRYKKPAGDKSILLTKVVGQDLPASNSDNLRFAAAVAEFGMLIRDSEFKQNASYSHVLETARSARGKDAEGYRRDFVKLVENAKVLGRKPKNEKDLGSN